MRLIFAIATLAALPAFAVGTEDDTPPEPTQTTTECTDGQIWDEKASACVIPKESQLDDDALFETARELGYAGRYEDALAVLAEAAEPNDPRILNAKGFAHRLAGRVEEAMGYYEAALEIDPDYLLARSYMGQALADQGDLEGAKLQLAEIRTRGGRDTWAYLSLKQALRGKTEY